MSGSLLDEDEKDKLDGILTVLNRLIHRTRTRQDEQIYHGSATSQTHEVLEEHQVALRAWCGENLRDGGGRQDLEGMLCDLLKTLQWTTGGVALSYYEEEVQDLLVKLKELVEDLIGDL